MRYLVMLILIIFAGSTFAGEQKGHEGHITVPQEKQKLAGIKTAVALVRPLTKLIRTTGIVAYDPELYSAQVEYAQARSSGSELAEAARLNLIRMGLNAEMIGKIAGGDDSLLVGSKDGPLWIYARIYENEAPLVKKGAAARVTAKSLPGKMFVGKIYAIDTVVDETTRSLKARVRVANKKELLKPNMYVDVMIEVPLGKKLTVPDDAVLDSGEKQIVFVEMEPGMFEPRKIIAGEKAQGYVVVVSGLRPGEKVAVSGNFLIDSESKLKSTGGGHAH